MRWRWLLGMLVLLGALFLAVGQLLPWRAVTDHPFFLHAGPPPLVIAHRGGAALWPENTLHAFQQAAALGTHVLEGDLHATADGVLVVLHDATVDRTTEGSGRVDALTLQELKALDAGYRWTPDGGRSFPYRGQGVTVPTVEELFAALPTSSFLFELKQPAPAHADELCRLVRQHAMTQRVMVASFHAAAVGRFRSVCPEVATSATAQEVRNLFALTTAGGARIHQPAAQALQVPEYLGGLRVLTPRLLDAAHQLNLQVHAWTVNDPAEMRRLLEMGVDGIITDYPDRMLAVIGR